VSEPARFSMRAANWLDDVHLLSQSTTNWKQQYKLRHNWAQGNCVLEELEVSSDSHQQPLLVRFSKGVIFTAAYGEGLRAWSLKGEKGLIGGINLTQGRIPTALCVDGCHRPENRHRLAVGFANGRFDIFEFEITTARFERVYKHSISTNGAISEISLHSNFLATMAESQTLSLYNLRYDSNMNEKARLIPVLLRSFKSHTASSPYSLSIRPSGTGTIMASIAFTMSTYYGFVMAVQEILFLPDGSLLNSRISYSSDRPENLSESAIGAVHNDSAVMSKSASHLSGHYSHSQSKPTSLSYTHPYLLVAHADNTLTLFLVKSTPDALSIGLGRTLWGHTSSVSCAQVGGRGKAVSVSRKGHELRVWELEGAFRTAMRRQVQTEEFSVKITPETKKSVSEKTVSLKDVSLQKNCGLSVAMEHCADEVSDFGDWIGFDEESVVVLRGKCHGKQAIAVYDFS
jgi:WD40 repeat protein